MPSENFDPKSSEHTNLQVVPFHGDQIVTFENDGRRFVAMRRIVENMGLSWGSQHSKLLEQREKFMCTDIGTHDTTGRTQSMLAMPVEKLPLWLACVNPNKIKNDGVRAKVELYQAESAIALHDFWTRGIAVRDDLAGLVTGLDPSVSDTIGGIVKRVVAKQLREAMADFLPGMVRKELSVGRFGVVIGDMSVGEILERYAKVRGQRGLVTKASASLRHFCASKGVAPLTQRAGRAWCYVFPEGVAHEWFETNGRRLVTEYQSAKAGQTVLPFPDRKRR